MDIWDRDVSALVDELWTVLDLALKVGRERLPDPDPRSWIIDALTTADLRALDSIFRLGANPRSALLQWFLDHPKLLDLRAPFPEP